MACLGRLLLVIADVTRMNDVTRTNLSTTSVSNEVSNILSFFWESHQFVWYCFMHRCLMNNLDLFWGCPADLLVNQSVLDWSPRPHLFVPCGCRWIVDSCVFWHSAQIFRNFRFPISFSLQLEQLHCWFLRDYSILLSGNFTASWFWWFSTLHCFVLLVRKCTSTICRDPVLQWQWFIVHPCSELWHITCPKQGKDCQQRITEACLGRHHFWP